MPHERHESLRNEGITSLGAQINFYPYFPRVPVPVAARSKA